MSPAIGDPLTELPVQLVALSVAGWFHERLDAEVLAGAARSVFGRPLAAAYLMALVLEWLPVLVLSVIGLTTGRHGPWHTEDPVVAVPLGLLVLGSVLTVGVVAWRVRRASSWLRGPLGDLATFFRIALGVAAPAAVRRLRAGA